MLIRCLASFVFLYWWFCCYKYYPSVCWSLSLFACALRTLNLLPETSRSNPQCSHSRLQPLVYPVCFLHSFCVYSQWVLCVVCVFSHHQSGPTILINIAAAGHQAGPRSSHHNQVVTASHQKMGPRNLQADKKRWQIRGGSGFTCAGKRPAITAELHVKCTLGAATVKL